MIDSLRGRTRLTFAGSIMAAVAVSIFGASAFTSLLSARRDLVDRADPALQASTQLLAALVDQETGVRAYVIASDPTFLEPYERGREDAALARDVLGDAARHLPDLEPLMADVDTAIAAWQDDYAEPTLDAAGDGDPGVRSEGVLAAGRARFDDIRATLGELDDAVLDARRSARQDLDDSTRELVVALALAAVVLVAIVGSLWALVRKQVQRPLEALGHDADEVTGGNLDHRIDPTGPAELRALGEALEAMRQRVVSDFRDLERSNAELEQFAYVASHDLQEPLRKVASFCQLLQSRYAGQLDERADQYIEFAVDGAKRMQALINDLLAFSRVGRLDGPMEVVDAGTLVDRALGNLDTAIEETGAVVDVGPLPAVRAEPTLGVALFQNLIGNAVKFHRPDVPPHVSVTASVDDDGAHRFVVTDNGIGIEPEYAERVFTIFQRLHTKDAYSGTGIGLALCRKIVEHHGGRIWVDTAAHPGTTIIFTLPPDEEAP